MHDSPPISIRQADSSDNNILAAIGAETFADAFGADNKPEDMERYLRGSFSPEIQAAELADPKSIFLIAEASHEPAGYARLVEGAPSAPLTASRPIEIRRLYARSPWIGRGVGAALMEACLSHAGRRGCDVIWLDVWERNKRAIRFYSAWGFVQFGFQAFVLGEDIQNDILMARPVSLPGGT